MRSDILRLVRAPNESLRLNIILYIQIIIWDKSNFARVTSEAKKPIKGYISAKLDIRTLFLREVTF